MSNKKRELKKAKIDPDIVSQLIIKAPNRRVVDVGNWRSATKSADNGRCKELYDLFADLLSDGILSDAISKRVDAVTNSELTFLDADGNAVDAIANLIDTVDFELLLKQIMQLVSHGRFGVEFNFDDGFKVSPIPPKHINLLRREILINDTDGTGINYDDAKNVLILGHADDFGLLLKAAPYTIYKRGGFGDWSQWIELFGMPQRIGKYNSADPDSRVLLLKALEEAGSCPYAVIPNETDVQTKETQTGSGAAYDQFRSACNEEVIITILGQLLTTTQGDTGSLALGEVHKAVEEGKNKSDMRMAQRILNTYVLPILEDNGYPVSGGRFIFPKTSAPISVGDIMQLSKIIDIPAEWVHDKFGIPQASEGDKLAKEVVPEYPQEQFTPPQLTDDKRAWGLFDFFVKAPVSSGAHWKNGVTPIRLSDNTLDNRIIRRIADGGGAYTFDTELYDLFVFGLTPVLTAFKQGICLADYAYGVQDDAFVTAMEQNLFHFSASKTLAEAQELNSIFRASTSFDDFYKKASQTTTLFNKTWADTEYQTAVLTAEAASNYQRLSKKTNLYPYWEYRTAGDGSVRSEHKALDGLILPANDARWDQIAPPNGFKCRCRIVPKMAYEGNDVNLKKERAICDQYFDTPDWQKAKAQGWGVNRGKTAEIFTQNQMYINKFPGKAGAYLDDMTAAKWGAEPVPALIKKATHATPVTAIGEGDIWRMASNGEVAKLTDHNGRTIVLSKDQFDAHTVGKKDNRVIYWHALTDALSRPDEIWLNNEQPTTNLFKRLTKGDAKAGKNLKYNCYNAIKYYNDGAIVANYKIEDNALVLKTWYKMQTEGKKGDLKKIWDSKRHGLLIKKPAK